MFPFPSRFTRQLLFFAVEGSSSGALRGASGSGAANLNAANLNPASDSASTSMNENLAASGASASGFVDFYQMLGQPVDVPTIQLRSRINEMYAEAQANRDHRIPERRRQYAALLQWIPQARVVLLHEGRRARYDAYAAQARLGQAPEDFRTYLNGLVGETDLDVGEGESILGLRGPTDGMPVPATARLSLRLDAVRAAAGEATSKAAAAANPAASAASSSTGTEGDAASPSRQPRRAGHAPRYDLNPELQKERASLLSSAAGFAVGLVVLLVTHIAFSNVHFIFSSAIAVAAGFMIWRAMRQRLLRDVQVQR